MASNHILDLLLRQFGFSFVGATGCVWLERKGATDFSSLTADPHRAPTHAMSGAGAPQAAVGAKTGPKRSADGPHAAVRGSQIGANATGHVVHRQAPLASNSSLSSVLGAKKEKRQRVKLCWGSDIRVVELVSPPELEEVGRGVEGPCLLPGAEDQGPHLFRISCILRGRHSYDRDSMYEERIARESVKT